MSLPFSEGILKTRFPKLVAFNTSQGNFTPPPLKKKTTTWMFPPQDGWFIMENPIKIDDLGVPLFLETPSKPRGQILPSAFSLRTVFLGEKNKNTPPGKVKVLFQELHGLLVIATAIVEDAQIQA